ncbi:hypothetical protein TNIN_162051 [Trichonephila inaurata madagascariensis]|uniref:Uncharacterized protein n=1 Tax=Trichonephila inaurata madagascariensis TaxID=2747483 RepID=A0A8X7BWL1_9ARAC|nr:hypothetical protein TNIN_162051 [Trichonephila inaurata madagascariensis]
MNSEVKYVPLRYRCTVQIGDLLYDNVRPRTTVIKKAKLCKVSHMQINTVCSSDFCPIAGRLGHGQELKLADLLRANKTGLYWCFDHLLISISSNTGSQELTVPNTPPSAIPGEYLTSWGSNM